MIQLFNISNYNIDTAKFSNLLHDKIVRELEQDIAQYVGAKYAVSFNSATSGLFLYFLSLKPHENRKVFIPSIIPPVVVNALINTNTPYNFIDKFKWVGGSYRLHENLIDSAQRIDENQYKNEAEENDCMLFSFYPTKPIGSCDGGMIVSNDKDKIELLRTMSFNGMSYENNNWERKISMVGHKMYMNSLQAYIAMQNFRQIDKKKKRLSEIRAIYNEAFKLNNTSEHLYRINVIDNKKFIAKAKDSGITCGIHYEALHLNPLYAQGVHLPLSENESKTTVSIPYHEALTEKEIQTVIKFVHENNA